MKIENVYFD